MDRIFFILTMAQTGLKTSAQLLFQRAKAQQAEADKEPNAAKKDALLKQVKRNASLAKALSAADVGITAYFLAD